MRRWLLRLSYLLLFLLWLAVMSVPAVAFVLATQDEIRLGEAPARYVRIFLISERDAQGIGIEHARWVEDPPGCVQTNVRFLMWEGESQAIVHCQCYNEQGDVTSVDQSSCSEE